MIDFGVSFCKGKKKSERDLHKLKFNIGEENKEKINNHDVNFITGGFT